MKPHPCQHQCAAQRRRVLPSLLCPRGLRRVLVAPQVLQVRQQAARNAGSLAQSL